jgi:hypothetical protein
LANVSATQLWISTKSGRSWGSLTLAETDDID